MIPAPCRGHALARSNRLAGGAGGDDVKFSATGQSGPAVAQRDVVTDFTKGLDRIDHSVIDTDPASDDDQAFAFIGTAEFTAPGQVRFELVNGITTVFVNTDRDAEADMVIELFGSVSLGGDDFVCCEPVHALADPLHRTPARHGWASESNNDRSAPVIQCRR